MVTECGFSGRENTTIVSISRLLRDCPLLLLLQPPEELCYSPFLGTAVTSPLFLLANRRRPPLPPPLEVEHRRQQLPGGEVRPQRGGEVHSGVRGEGGALPQQEVRQADLAGGPTEMTLIGFYYCRGKSICLFSPYEQVHFCRPVPRGVQAALEQGLADVLRLEEAKLNALGGLADGLNKGRKA